MLLLLLSSIGEKGGLHLVRNSVVGYICSCQGTRGVLSHGGLKQCSAQLDSWLGLLEYQLNYWLSWPSWIDLVLRSGVVWLTWLC